MEPRKLSLRVYSRIMSLIRVILKNLSVIRLILKNNVFEIILNNDVFK